MEHPLVGCGERISTSSRAQKNESRHAGSQPRSRRVGIRKASGCPAPASPRGPLSRIRVDRKTRVGLRSMACSVWGSKACSLSRDAASLRVCHLDRGVRAHTTTIS